MYQKYTGSLIIILTVLNRQVDGINVLNMLSSFINILAPWKWCTNVITRNYVNDIKVNLSIYEGI